MLKAFDDEPYPELQKKIHLAEQLGVTTAQISKWFQHRREHLTRLGQFKAQYNRTRRTPEQLDVLQTAFEEDRYPSAEKLAHLESQLSGVTVKQIKLWFKHRRKQVQKRNRTNSSPRLISTAHSHPSHLSSPHNAFKHMRHDASAAAQDAFRTDWRAGAAVAAANVGATMAVMPNAHSHPLPVQSLVPNPSGPAGVPYPFDPHYYPYKGPHLVLAPQSQFSELEVMALRGAHAVSNAKPTQEGIIRLAQMLNRHHTLLDEWFRVQQPSSRPAADLLPDPTQQNLQPYGQSTPTIQDPPISRPYSTASTVQQASPILQDYRAKMDHDMVMTSGTAKAPNVNSSSSKATSIRDQEMERSHFENKQTSDASSGSKPAPPGKASPQHPVTQQVPPGVLSTYMYPNGFNPSLDPNVVMPHQAAAFHAAQVSSAPILAPLRYMPTNPPGQAYIHPNTVWYHHTPTFQK